MKQKQPKLFSSDMFSIGDIKAVSGEEWTYVSWEGSFLPEAFH